ncbi:multidrug resistance-associated ABC transporter [Dichomitus squalens]|uniref:Multidrug resistance-associated ABC transporter n=1 Tax=Dichomitus squalens TaxID=114155 RepID=A0A4Q9MKW0_9APHY|nr:multidrug resistance-associated ABC transporter [Dichomitus squalens]
MPAYQLHVAAALGVALLVSATNYVLSGTKEKEGKTALPTFVEGEEGLLRDPFDVTEPEDLVDGQPLDEQRFWNRMRLRKILLSLLLGAVLAIQAISLGWSITESDSVDIMVYSLHTAFALYALILASRSVNQTYSAHATAIVHLSALTFTAFVFLAITAIIPSSPFPFSGIPAPSSLMWGSAWVKDGAPLGLWYATLALYFAAAAVAVTTPRGPKLHFPSERMYSAKTLMQTTSRYEDNVDEITGASVLDYLLFSYTTKVVMLGYTSESLEIGDLPVLEASMRATALYAQMRVVMRRFRLRIGAWRPTPGSGIELVYRLARVNLGLFVAITVLATIAAVLFYVPAMFLRGVVRYLEVDPERENKQWGFVFCAGLFLSHATTQILTGQLWGIATTVVQVRTKLQLNTILFQKTLVRKDIASSSSEAPKDATGPERQSADGESSKKGEKKDDEDDFSSKAQVMTLMTTDVDRIAQFGQQLFTIVDAPIEIVIGTLFLYSLLGVSCFFGLAVACLFLPMNHFAGKVVVGAQENLMKARDERVALMNEILGGIKMLKFMAWERSFEKRVLKVRERELKYQKLNYTIEVLWNAIWNGSPILVTLVSFWHFAVVRKQVLTPSIAFTSISVFNEMKFALNALPETLINMLQCAVSLRRIEKYLYGAEVKPVPPLDGQAHPIALQSATITWPQDRSRESATPSAAATPRNKFVLMDVSLDFPLGELSLICGKLGSGKSLLLLALLGEADLLSGQLLSPRSPPDTIAKFAKEKVSESEWVVEGVCAYVPQSAWLRNASIRDNILFDLPYVEERYQKTLEACALLSDLDILEDGDQSEIGERGVNLSGGQKARVSLARAVYSRAAVLFLDDVLSAVDAHTAHHLFNECLKGDLMRGRTVILVSHHVQLCAPGTKYIVALDNGRVQYTGDYDGLQSSGVLSTLIQSSGDEEKEDATAAEKEKQVERAVEDVAEEVTFRESTETSETSSTVAPTQADGETKPDKKQKAPRKLVEEEKRAVGHIGKDIWVMYLSACGSYGYWIIFACSLGVGALSPVFENGWLKVWSGANLSSEPKSPTFYITVYAAITGVGLILTTLRWFVLYHGGIHGSVVLYKRLLEAVLFAKIRFHDTVSRGRLLNRFGKDFEGIDSSLPDNFGRSVMYGLSVLTTFITVSVVGGPTFLLAGFVFGFIFYSIGKVYGQTSRDMRRLDSVTRSPLYSIYGETIAGVAVVRAFGASSKYLRDICYADTNANPVYWMWGVNRWLSARFLLLSSCVVALVALVAVMTPRIDASLAGFALAFSGSFLMDLLWMVRRFVGLEQSMVAVERVKEFSELPQEPPEFIEPRPPASWPEKGEIKCEDLVIRYAPDLPNVLHHLSFEIRPGEKVGVLGRTGSGKSTLALSFFRFVEPVEGRILIDGLDISQIGLTDLRSKLTIIPQDPTILSGTLRSTLDVFDEYEDAEIYEALRRVHLIPSGEETAEEHEGINVNVFRNLDSSVSEGGENFSTGEKQLLCMARAILKRSRVLLMDEATASVDYATDELIGKTIRQEFASSTILTIAHRLRTVIDYDRVMLLDQGRIVEFDTPAALLSNPQSKFYALCKATGKQEFAVLKKMAGA